MPQINLGATVCEKLKTVYHSEKKWIDCYKDVTTKFNKLKNEAKKFYVDKDDKEILQELGRFNHSDIIDALEGVCKGK